MNLRLPALAAQSFLRFWPVPTHSRKAASSRRCRARLWTRRASDSRRNRQGQEQRHGAEFDLVTGSDGGFLVRRCRAATTR